MLKQITDDLVADLDGLTFGPPVSHVYNPLVYARQPWDLYCERFGRSPKEVLLVGLNPGPFGMAQVGVPFGEVSAVRDWLDIEAPVGRPVDEHPKRPIQGFACPRTEVSGARLWGWAQERFGTPDAFFARFFVANYCPLVFMETGGRNRTPDKLPKAERTPMDEACDRALRRTVEHFQPQIVAGVGKFAEKKARQVVGDLDLNIVSVPHPSPANPAANRGWARQMTSALEEAGIAL
ncbi:MAG: single-stranded DNA-binding protein [Deltaproteobacteria bacterium]|nr:single-stranded DNA-binding protein [Deltaproteobacteria bacterium]